MDRPGLQTLLADIGLGRIDTVVVYKVDRLTRALTDFAKMVELFDRHDVTFVAITQQFNTTTSMGRLTLNILLSFAQFEREVIGERVRDKIAASKRKGMWMGGNVPLGYKAEGRTLVINPDEAETVRTIFRQYHEAGSVYALKRGLDRQGIVTKQRVSTEGHLSGGRPFAAGNLYEMLANPVYIGQIRHKGACHPGLHEPIIDQALWDETQARLNRNRQGTKERRANAGSAPLLDKLFDETGERLVPTHAQKQGRRYRYYTSHFLIVRDPDETRKGWRVPAAALEKAISSSILSLLHDRAALSTAWQKADLPFDQFGAIAPLVERASPERPLDLVERIDLAADGLTMRVSLSTLVPDGPVIVHRVPMTMRRRGQEMRMIIDSERRPIDPALVSAVARGRTWFEELSASDAIGMAEIAERESLSKGRVSQLVKLAFLSPKIVQAIIEGRQPLDLTVRKLIAIDALPVAWAEQEAALGF